MTTDPIKQALAKAASDLLTVGNDYPGSSCQKWCTERAVETLNALGTWKHCPSTHCERAQECRSPNECSGLRTALAQPPASSGDRLRELVEQLGDLRERELEYVRLLPEVKELLEMLASEPAPKADEVREALEWIDYHADNQDMSHVEFRVHGALKARYALDAFMPKDDEPVDYRREFEEAMLARDEAGWLGTSPAETIRNLAHELRELQSSPKADERDSVIAQIIQDVCELPDDHADDEPDLLKVTVEELEIILRRALKQEKA